MCFFTCSPRPPTLSQRHMDLHVWSYPRPDYIFQVSSKSVQGFRSLRGVKIWPFPLLWLVAFTTARTTVQAVINCSFYFYLISSNMRLIEYGGIMQMYLNVNVVCILGWQIFAYVWLSRSRCLCLYKCFLNHSNPGSYLHCLGVCLKNIPRC